MVDVISRHWRDIDPSFGFLFIILQRQQWLCWTKVALMEVNVATMGISYHWKHTLSHHNDKASPNAPRLYEMSKKYGPLMELRLGTSKRILVALSPNVS